MLSIKTARTMMDFLWPAFVERQGAVILETVCRDVLEFETFRDLSTAEAFYNHEHILDHFRHQVPGHEHPEHGYWVYDDTHTDFLAAWDIGLRLADAWRSKLAADFPGRRFRVYLTRHDAPIVRFHQVRVGEPMWAEGSHAADAIASGELAVFDTQSLHEPSV